MAGAKIHVVNSVSIFYVSHLNQNSYDANKLTIRKSKETMSANHESK